MTRASGTTRGSAVSRPGTSFHSDTVARAQRPAEQRRRQVGAAAAQRGHRALLGHPAAVVLDARAADEAGDDRDLAGRDQRLQLLAHGEIGEREVGRRAAERSLGEHDLRRVDVDRRRADRGHRPREDLGRQPLAAADHEIARPRGQLLERGEARQQRGELVHGAVDLGGDARPRTLRADRGEVNLVVAGAQRGDVAADLAALLARDGARREPEQDVGDARRRRHHDDRRSRPALHDRHGVPVGRAVIQRRAAELVDHDVFLAGDHLRAKRYRMR